jgi:TPR repeat protein
MSEEAKRYGYTVTYERQDALDASSFFMDMNEQGRGVWRVAVALFGIALFAMCIAICFVPPGQGPSRKGLLQAFLAAAVALSWSVDPALRDFTRRLWLPRGRALTADFSDAGVTIESHLNGSRFTAWSDVASVTERADGILLIFKDDAVPVPGMNPLYRRLTSVIGSPIVWLPTRSFVSYEEKWELRDFARQFVPQSTDRDTSFFRLHIATFVVMILVVVSSFAVPSWSTIHEAQYRKGLRYLAGEDVIRDDARGVSWITTAAQGGVAPAQYELGMLYTEGSHGVAKNSNWADYWFRAAANGGIIEAQEKVAKIDQQIRDSQAGPTQEMRQQIADNYAADALSRYGDAAEQGDAQAQYKLGDLYESGYGVPKNLAAALEWYTKAANHGNSLAQDRLGHIYDEGIGVPRNSTAAIEWYKKAAEQGEDLDQYKLGQIYSDGREVPKDIAEAIMWYRKAAERGFGAATYQLRALGVTDTAPTAARGSKVARTPVR